MRSPLGPLLANVFMCSTEDKLDQDGKLPSYYRWYVDDAFTIMPDIASAGALLDTLSHSHPSAKFTIDVERNSSLPFIGIEMLNLAPRIKTKVYVKPTSTGLLIHYQSQVDIWYKRSLITTMLDRAYRISSDLSSFSQECHQLETVPFKVQVSANVVKNRLTDLSSKIKTAIQPVFISRKLNEDLKVREDKSAIVNQQCLKCIWHENFSWRF